MDQYNSLKRLAFGLTLVVMAGVTLACSSARDDPLLSAEELYTPTPVLSDTLVESDTPAQPETKTDAPAEPEATATSEPADLFGFDYNGKVAFAQWDDPALQMENFIVGYIIVQGMVYEIELVEVAEDEYPSALQSGDVDVVLEAGGSESSAQFTRLLESGEVIDVGLPVRRGIRRQDRRAG